MVKLLLENGANAAASDNNHETRLFRRQEPAVRIR